MRHLHTFFVCRFLSYTKSLFIRFILSAAIYFDLVRTVFSCYQGNADTNKFSSRDGYLAVVISWIVFSLLGTLPYLLSNTIPSFIDAFFESTSGFTTTGSSIMRDVEILPYSILFWRSLTHWFGGIGIIVLVNSYSPFPEGHRISAFQS